MQSKCVLVRKCEVKRKGKAADKIVVDGKIPIAAMDSKI